MHTPYRTQFFHFRIHFCQKVPVSGSTPPSKGSIPPTENPGSATGDASRISKEGLGGSWFLKDGAYFTKCEFNGICYEIKYRIDRTFYTCMVIWLQAIAQIPAGKAICCKATLWMHPSNENNGCLYRHRCDDELWFVWDMQ